MANGLCGVAETGRERCQGAPDAVFWGERLSSGKPCHDIGEREGEVVQVPPETVGVPGRRRAGALTSHSRS